MVVICDLYTDTDVGGNLREFIYLYTSLLIAVPSHLKRKKKKLNASMRVLFLYTIKGEKKQNSTKRLSV